MPQMSPMSWLLICATLLVMLMITFNVTLKHSSGNKLTLPLKKKENPMKW